MTRKDNDKLKRNEMINIILKEYDMVRNETRMFFNLQFTVVGIWITLIGVLLGFIFNKFIDSSSSEINASIMELILIIILPGVSDFLGMIWLDFSMRITKNAFFTYGIEEKINKIASVNKMNLIEWEHYKKSDSQSKTPVKLINYFYYFIMIGCFFFVVPAISLYLIYIFENSLTINYIYYIVFAIIEITTLFFALIYIKKILSLDKH